VKLSDPNVISPSVEATLEVVALEGGSTLE